LVIVLLGLLAIGGALIYVGVAQKSYLPVSAELQTCAKVVSTSLFPGDSVFYDCQAVAGGWADVNVGSRLNTTLTISLIRPDQTSVQAYSSSGNHFHVLLPIFENGTLDVKVVSQTNAVTTLTGSVGMFVQTSTQTLVSTPGHPYRTAGLGVVVVGAVGLMVAAIDPRGYVSSPFGRKKAKKEAGGKETKGEAPPQRAS
jgi:hypothetical protein